jgi:hypothetical protein
MTIQVIYEEPKRNDEEKIGNLQYGTIVTGIERHRDSVYIKVNKHCSPMAVSISVTHRHSLLFNVKSATFRAVRGDTTVRVLEGKFVVSQGRPEMFKKY